MGNIDWLPISEEAKSGKDVLLYYPLDGLNHANHPQIIIGFWRDNKAYPLLSGWTFQGRAVRGYSEEYQPTHWAEINPPGEITDDR